VPSPREKEQNMQKPGGSVHLRKRNEAVVTEHGKGEGMTPESLAGPPEDPQRRTPSTIEAGEGFKQGRVCLGCVSHHPLWYSRDRVGGHWGDRLAWVDGGTWPFVTPVAASTQHC
jgi:hypothetical protein